MEPAVDAVKCSSYLRHFIQRTRMELVNKQINAILSLSLSEGYNNGSAR